LIDKTVLRLTIHIYKTCMYKLYKHKGTRLSIGYLDRHNNQSLWVSFDRPNIGGMMWMDCGGGWIVTDPGLTWSREYGRLWPHWDTCSTAPSSDCCSWHSGTWTLGSRTDLWNKHLLSISKTVDLSEYESQYLFCAML